MNRREEMERLTGNPLGVAEACPRCSDELTLRLRSDEYGRYISCLACGYHEDLRHKKYVKIVQEGLRLERSKFKTFEQQQYERRVAGAKDRDLLTVTQAADALNVGIAKMYEFARSGRAIGAHQFNGKRWLIPAPLKGAPELDPPLSSAEKEAMASRRRSKPGVCLQGQQAFKCEEGRRCRLHRCSAEGCLCNPDG